MVYFLERANIFSLYVCQSSLWYLSYVMVCCLMLCYVLLGCTVGMCKCCDGVLFNLINAIVFMAQRFRSGIEFLAILALL